MIIIVNIIKILIVIGLSLGLLLFIHNKFNLYYKVKILPVTTTILSILFSYHSYSNNDILSILIWICIFLFSISILLAYKINYKNLDHINNQNSLSQIKSEQRNQLDDLQLNNIYAFFKLNEFLTNDLNFNQFKESFLKTPINLNMDIPSLREFFNHLKIQRGIYIKNINDDFLQYFINSKTKEYYKYNQFISEAKPNSKYSLEIKKLFNHF